MDENSFICDWHNYFIAIAVLLYLLIAGADESRRSKGLKGLQNTDNENK